MLNTHFWDKVPLGPPDAILGITEAFKADKDASKINLGVGAYRDDKGNPYVLESVKRAKQINLQKYPNHEYATIAGVPEFIAAAAKLAYGSNCPQLNQVAAVQSISGTGALRIGGAFLNRFFDGNKTVYMPSPTWGNHPTVFRDSGLSVASYRYFDSSTNGLDFEGMKQDILNAPQQSIILLHACAHNPTGVDPKPEQWNELSLVIKEKSHLAFFDMAYQGFASGDPDKDAYAVRKFTSDGHELLLAQSFAKNMGLYGERAGLFSVVAGSKVQAAAIDSQLRILVRGMYSNPPIHGGRIVSTILDDAELNSLWLQEVKAMADRIIKMRHLLKSELENLGSKRDWRHITDQIGMFCYTGMKPDQVERITKEFHVYLTKDGRISIAGINSENVKRLAMAMHEVTKDC